MTKLDDIINEAIEALECEFSTIGTTSVFCEDVDFDAADRADVINLLRPYFEDAIKQAAKSDRQDSKCMDYLESLEFNWIGVTGDYKPEPMFVCGSRMEKNAREAIAERIK